MKSVYLLLGPEEGEKEIFIKNEIKKIKTKLQKKPQIYTFYPFDTAMIDIVSSLQNEDLFSDHRIVILKNIEEIKLKQDIDILSNYIKKPSPNSTLMLLSATFKGIPKKIENSLPKENKTIFWEMFENKKVEWIRNYFKSKSIKIDPDAVQFLLNMVENNTKELKKECSTLALFFGENSTLKLEELEKYVYHSKHENIFTLFESITKRDLDSSLDILDNILLSKESDSIAILSGLLWQVRNLLQLKMLLKENYSFEDAFLKIKIKYLSMPNSQKTFVFTWDKIQSWTLQKINTRQFNILTDINNKALDHYVGQKRYYRKD